MMITFGYNNKISSLSRALAALGVGLVMVFGASGCATVTLVKVIASLILAAGLVSLLFAFDKRSENSSRLVWFNAVVDCAIGLLLFFFPGWLAGFVVSLIGVALVIFGVLQMIVLSTVMSFLGKGFATLILSAAAIIGGIFLVFSHQSEVFLSYVAGVLLMVYGISEVLSTFKVSKAREEYEVRYASDITSPGASSSQETQHVEITDAKEVEFHKIDEQ